MKNIYFTVGPTQVYPTVVSHISKAIKEDIVSISHRGEQFKKIFEKAVSNLRDLLNIPLTHHIFFIPSSTESFERIIANTVYKKSTHLVTGGFSKKFYQTALDLKKQAIAITIPIDKKFDWRKLIIPKDTELLCVTENETSNGVQIPLAIFSDIKEQNKNLLLAVDIVSSTPYSYVDYEVFDISFFSVQKGFGLPAGLGVLIVNEKALDKALFLLKKGINMGSRHHSFLNLAEKEKKFTTPGTPNVFNIYLLSKVTQDFLEIGLKKIRNDTDTKAKMLYDLFDSEFYYKPIISGGFRSKTTLTINVKGKAQEIASALAQKGCIVSKGYHPQEEEYIRIGNFPAHHIDHVQKLISALKELRVT